MQRIIYMLSAGLLAFFTLSAYAHNTNKVVVIPMAGDPPPIKAITPLAPANPSGNNYLVVVDNTGNGEDTIIDRTTGLEWQREDDDTTLSWEVAFDHCDGLNPSPSFAGKTGWRMPTIRELQSMVDYGKFNPAIEGIFNTNFDGGAYEFWSASSDATSGSNVWAIEFNRGRFSKVNRTSALRVRCVRGESLFTPALQDNGNGTVTDLTTALTWQKQDDNVERNNAEAISYCNNLTLGGKSDWRLPNIKELTSIVDFRTLAPAIDKKAFPNTDSRSYWSATGDAGFAPAAWGVGFSDGLAANFGRDVKIPVRCVRKE